MKTHAIILTGVIALAAAPLTTGCGGGARADNQADGQYLEDLDARGVPTGVTNGAPPELGHAVCKDLDAGSDAGSKVLQVANFQLGHKPQFTVMQAEEVVYWAVTDLCPTHSSQLRESWRDGN